MLDIKVEKTKEAKRRYRKANRDKAKIYNSIYREKNKEKISKINKEYRGNNKEKIKEYNQQNKGKYKLSVIHKRLRASEYKLKVGCQICSYKQCADALDFHHTSQENKIVDMNRLRERKWEHFLKEAQKCIVVCRNCHAEIHYRQRNHLKGEGEK